FAAAVRSRSSTFLRCRHLDWASGMCPTRPRSIRFAARRRIAAAADEAGIGPEQARDQAAEGHEALALAGETDLAVGRVGDVPRLALFVDATVDRPHLHDIAVNEDALELGGTHRAAFDGREEIDAARPIHGDREEHEEADVEAQR